MLQILSLEGKNRELHEKFVLEPCQHLLHGLRIERELAIKEAHFFREQVRHILNGVRFLVVLGGEEVVFCILSVVETTLLEADFLDKLLVSNVPVVIHQVETHVKECNHVVSSSGSI